MVQTEKKTVLKRGLALLVTLIMIFGLIPMTVFAATVDVVYDLNGGTSPYPTTDTVEESTQFYTAYAPVRDGYIFSGWLYNSSTFNAHQSVTAGLAPGTMTFVAQWTPSGTPATNTIAYVADAAAVNMPDTTPLTVKSGTLVALSATPFKTNKTFAGWKESSGTVYGAGQTVAVTGDLEFTALWIDSSSTTLTTYTVEYVADADAVAMPSGTVLTVSDGTLVALAAAPVKEGKVFAGWKDTDDTVYGAGETVAVSANMKLTAQWADNAVSVTFDLDGGEGSFAAMNVAKNANFSLPSAEPTKENYVFKGWSYDSKTYAPGATLLATGTAMEFKAVWQEVDVFEVTSATVPDGLTVTDFEAGSITDAYTKDMNKNDEFSFTVEIASAYYKGKAPVVKANGAYLVGELVDETDTSYVYYYHFIIKNDTALTYGTTALNKFVVSVPIGEHFDVTITEPAAAASDKSAEVAYDDDFAFKVEARDGWEIKNVYANGVLLTAEAGGTTASQTFKIEDVEENKAILVDVEEIPSYLVTYYLKYGDVTEVYTTQYVLRDQKATAPVVPSVEGYTFDKWCIDSAGTTAYDFDTKVTADLILYSSFKKNTYKVTYDINGGKDTTLPATNPQERAYGDPYVIPADIPTWTDGSKRFIGWNTNKTAETALYVPGDSIEPTLAADITLYAIWENVEYNVNLFPGTGYSIWTEQSTTVLWGDDFDFSVRFDKGYTEGLDDTTVLALIKVNGVALKDLAKDTVYKITAGTLGDDESLTYTVTLLDIKEDKNVTVVAGKNKLYTVNYHEIFVYKDGTRVVDEAEVELPILDYVSQDVEWNTLAPVPVPPVAEGYKFEGWYKVTDLTAEKPFAGLSVFPFATEKIKAITNLYAKMVLEQITVTFPAADGAGYDIQYNADQVKNYGDDLEFWVKVMEGYDATNLVVAANGFAINPVSITTGEGFTQYNYKLINLTEDTDITVNGIERKTVIIIYNDNDGVAGPVYQIANYYLKDAADNSELVKEPLPTRIGYTFEGWSIDPEDTELKAKVGTLKGAYTAAEIAAGVISEFQEDDVLYAIWKEAPSGITLVLDKTEYYEGEDVLLTATVTYTNADGDTVPVTSGKVFFYQNGELIGSTEAEGGIAKITATTSDYDAVKTENIDYYEAVYVPTEGEGYAASQTSADITFDPATSEITEAAGYEPLITADILSRSITWPLTRTSTGTPAVIDEYVITEDTDVITVIDSGDNDVTGDPLKAGDKYTLILGDIYALTDGYEDENTGDTLGTALKVGNDYYIVWQYKVDSGDWTDLVTVSDSQQVVVTPGAETTCYRALVYPVGAPETELDRAAQFDDDDKLVAGKVEFLVSKPTSSTERKPTTITLTSDKSEYAEGEDIVLDAFVTYIDADGEVAYVEDGMVYFYHKLADDTDYELIATVEAKGGFAEYVTTASDYNAFAILNADDFEAVYVPVANDVLKFAFTAEHITFNKADGSIATDTDYVAATVRTLIDSRAITWALDRTANDDGTGAIVPDSYKITDKANVLTIKNEADEVVTTMTANEPYTLTIPTVYALTTGYTDVADGTAVANTALKVGNDYVITWQYKNDHGDWVEYTTVSDSDSVLVTPEYSKYQFRAKVLPLIGDTSIFTKGCEYDDADKLLTSYTDAIYTVATSATVQNTVHVVVSASDEILATDTVVDVYQGNEITLKAVVTSDDDPVKPFGSVTFYYVDEAGNEVKIETTDLVEDGNETDGYEYTAEIVTDVLPVREDGTYQEIEIYAIYTENDTFAEKDSRDDLADPADACLVYVMSSVINVDVDDIAVENLYNHDTTKGNIYITVDGARDDGDDVIDPVANDSNVTLRLGDVYTRDVRRDDYLTGDTTNIVPDEVMLLTYGTNYTVQWQKLTNVDAYLDSDGKPLAGIDEREIPWEDIAGETGTSCHITAEEGTAYRAVVIPLETPATFGSYNEVEEPVAGRGEYYSNILRVRNGEATVAFYLNTSDVDDEHKGVVEGEKVYVQIFESGSAAVAPISDAYVGVFKDSDNDGDLSTGSPELVFSDNIAVTNGYGAVEWDTADCEPGYYFVEVFDYGGNNSFDSNGDYRTVIVRDNDYSIEVDEASQKVTYDGQFHGLDVTINDMDIESDLANTVWTVSYYKAEGVSTDPETGVKTYGDPVYPKAAGDYVAVVTLAESRFWTPETIESKLTIERRQVKVVDLVAAVKYYNGKTDANLLEITLNDAVTDQTTTGLPTDNLGVINGDIVYVTGDGYTKAANAGATEVGVKNAKLVGPDAGNYVFDLTDGYTYTEAFEIQRNQLSGYIIADWTQDLAWAAEGKTLASGKYVLYDQYGTKIENPQIYYYYHNGQGIEKVDSMLYRGVYTVIVTMDQNNYKGGLSTIVGVNATVKATASGDPKHTVILFADTTTVYNPAGNKPVKVTPTLATATVKAEYYVSGAWTETVPANAGRYLVKATASTGDVAYGLYTVLKAHPELTIFADDAEYTSAQYAKTNLSYSHPGEIAETYWTFVGDTVQGLPEYQRPTNVGTYTATLHTEESENYAPHEISVTFEITPKQLDVYAGQYQRGQYLAFSQYIPEYDGLADEGIVPDTTLRDVQIEPEIVFNMTDGIVNVDNNALDQVGVNKLYIGAGLASNYEIVYHDGQVVTTAADPECELAIKGMPKDRYNDNVTFYGDSFRLYTYGDKVDDIVNTSSLYTWAVDNSAMIEGAASVDENGNVEVDGVGVFTITLTRGYGAQAIETTETFFALPQEVMVYVPNQDYLFDNTVKTYDITEMEIYNAMFDKVLDYTYLDKAYLNRKQIGVNNVLAVVNVGVTTNLYCSEIYGGLLTVNDKEVTVNVADGTHVYGGKSTEGHTYIEGEIVPGLASLTDVVSAAHTVNYDNLDCGSYEILYAGRENINYNVKYTTAPTVGKESVTKKGLTVTSGAYNAFTGRTFVTNVSGKTYYNSYLPSNDDALMKIDHTTTAPDFQKSTMRMYGEANKSMALKIEGLIPGDSMADLAKYNSWLNLYGNRIDENARGLNYTKANADVHYHANEAEMTLTDLVASRSTLPVDYYDVVNNSSMVDFKNYNVTYVTGDEHIYQRPVALKNYKLDGTALTGTEHIHLHMSYMLDSANNYAKLRNYLLDKRMIRAEKFNGKGGLATALDHTIADLLLNWNIVKTSDTQLKITITLGNDNYWLAKNVETEEEKFIFYIDFDKYSYIVDYENTIADASGDCFLAGYSIVTLYYVDGVLTGDASDESLLSRSYLPNDDKLYCYIYRFRNDGDYSNVEPLYKYEFTKVEGKVGVYRCNYRVLPNGNYCMFAVTNSDSYNLINDKNH